jgi:hypothetical protein
VLCRHLKDPKRNGGRSAAAVIDHRAMYLVTWAWSPGTDDHGGQRSPPPLPYAYFLRRPDVGRGRGSPFGRVK